MEASTGQILWSVSTPQAVTSRLAVWKDFVVFGCRDRRVRVVNLASGSPVHELETGGFVEGGAAGGDAAFYIGGDDGVLRAVQADGSLLWRYDALGEIKSTPLLAAGLVVFGTSRGLLTALDQNGGGVRWQQNLPAAMTTNSPVLDGDHCLIGDEGGFVRRVALADGAVAWTTSRSLGSLRNGMALLGGALFVGTLDRTLFVLDAATGAVRREIAVDGPIYAAPVVVGRAVVVVTESGHYQAYLS